MTEIGGRSLNTKTVVRLVVSFSLGGLTTWLFLSSNLFEFSKESALIAGLLITILSELTILVYEQAEAERADEVIISLSRALSRGGSFSNFIAQQIISDIHGRAVKTYSDGIEIRDPERVPLFWTACLMHLEDSLQVTSHIHPSHWWNKGYSDTNLSVQFHKAQEGKRIERIFIWSSFKLTEHWPVGSSGLGPRTSA